MKITRVEMHSGDELLVDFNIAEPANKSPYVVKAMIGLDATELTPRFYGESHDQKTSFYETILPSREIVIRTAFRQDLQSQLTPSDLRDHLYRSISRSRSGEVELRFMNGQHANACVFGRIVKMEVPHFSKAAEAQLTIDCIDPLFYGMNAFEAQNPPSTLVNLVRSLVLTDDVSTAPHGLFLRLQATADCDKVLVFGPNQDWGFEVHVDLNAANQPGVQSGLVAGDGMEIESSAGSRSLVLTIQSALFEPRVPAADMITMKSTWPTIFPGENEYILMAENNGIAVSPPLATFVRWHPRFWGV